MAYLVYDISGVPDCPSLKQLSYSVAYEMDIWARARWSSTEIINAPTCKCLRVYLFKTERPESSSTREPERK